jgi:hypothetical protein
MRRLQCTLLVCAGCMMIPRKDLSGCAWWCCKDWLVCQHCCGVKRVPVGWLIHQRGGPCVGLVVLDLQGSVHVHGVLWVGCYRAAVAGKAVLVEHSRCLQALSLDPHGGMPLVAGAAWSMLLLPQLLHLWQEVSVS